MENTNQKQEQKSDDSDSNKKESTNSGENNNTPSTSLSKPKDIIHEDVCAICQDDVSILDVEKYSMHSCCGKVIHVACAKDLHASKLNQATKIERLQKWSQRGKSWAQSGLANLYSIGNGVKKNPKRAFDYYKLAADQGDHIAQYNLGTLYEKGQGVTQSAELAFKYYKLSAEQGMAEAQYNVGFAYSKGNLVAQSDTKACKYYALAADQGHRDAQYNLGYLYEQGRCSASSVDGILRAQIPFTGSCNEKEFFIGSNPMEYVFGIRCPVVIVNSQDDMVCLPENIREDIAQENGGVLLVRTEEGSHIAYSEGMFGSGNYLIRISLDFLESAMAVGATVEDF